MSPPAQRGDLRLCRAESGRHGLLGLSTGQRRGAGSGDQDDRGEGQQGVEGPEGGQDVPRCPRPRRAGWTAAAETAAETPPDLPVHTGAPVLGPNTRTPVVPGDLTLRPTLKNDSSN